MKHRIIKSIIFAIALFNLALPVLAATTIPSPSDRMKNVAEKSGYTTSGDSSAALAETIGLAVSALLGLLGVIFIVLMLYAGFNWMTAMGDENKVDKAKDTIRTSIIGLIIIISAYAIWALIYNYLLTSSS